MLLLEIAAQGVRGFAPQSGRVVLRPGYNVVSGDGAALLRLVGALLHPDRPPDPSLRAASAAGGARARAGLTLSGDDGVTWRVVRDLAGPCQLQRYDPERRAFQSAGQDPARIAEILRAAGVPSAERFGAVLSLQASDFPSRSSPGGLPSAGLAPATPVPQPRRSLDPAEARERLEALRAERERARGSERLQAEMDALQSRLFKLEELLKSGEQVRERVRSAEAAVAALASTEAAVAALRDPAGRILAWRKATARKDEALQKIAQEREEQLGSEVARPEPLWRQPGFAAGAIVGVASLAGSVLLGVRSLALVAIPATAAAAFEGLRWVGRAEAFETAGRRTRWLAERERKAIAAWEKETADVRGAAEAAGLKTVAELSDVLGRIQEARAALADARAGFADWEGQAVNQDAEEERRHVQAEIGEMEHQLTTETGGFVRDIQSLEVEIARLERELETPGADAAPAPLPDPSPSAPAPRGPTAPRGDPLRTLFESASRELTLSPGALLRAMQPRIVQVLPALSVQRLANFFVDERGNLQVQAGGKLVPAATLQPGDRDLCFAVLKVAIAEQGLAAGKAVAVLEDAFAVLPEGSRRVLARLLKQIARGRQVVHGTTDPIFREAADHAA